ncbi:MAG: DUF58 domain-containing protein [Bdellovibrionales bacterium]
MVLPFFQLRQSAEEAIADVPALKQVAERVALHILHGSHGQKKAGGTEKFWQFRDYTTNDRPQDIDWRQSAKGDHIFVREKELHTPQSVYFWANNNESMQFKSEQAEHSKSEAAQILSLAIALLLQRGDEYVGVLGRGQAGRSDSAIDRLGQALLEKDSVLPAGSLSFNSGVVFCSDFLEPFEHIESTFSPFLNATQHGLVLHVLDPAEIELPYDGRVVFEDGIESKHVIDNVSSIREAYKTQVQMHIDNIRALCVSHNWQYHLHVTDCAFETTLLEIWEGAQR